MSGTATGPGRWRHSVVTLTVLGSSSLTVMAAALVAPIIPALQAHFASHPHVELLAPMILTLPALAIVGAGYFCGLLVDRLRPARLLGLACLVYGACGSAGLWVDSLGLLAASRLGLGIGIAGIMTAATRLIGELYAGSARARMLGRQAAAMALGSALCLGLGGLLGEGFWRWPFAVYLLGLVFAGLSLGLPRRAPDAAAENAAGDSARGTTDAPVASPRHDRMVTALAVGAIFAFFALFYLVPVRLPFEIAGYTANTSGISGLFLMLMSAVAGAVSMGFGRLKHRLSSPRLLLLTFLALAAALAVVALAGPLALFAPAMTLAGLALGLVVPTVNNWIVSEVTGPRQGRALGLMSSGMFLGQFVSPLASQPLVEALGATNTFFVGALGGLAVAAVLCLGWLAPPRKASPR